jgi:hypothetical protein
MEVSDAYLILLVKTVTTLLPLVPAYLLFRALPSQAEISGPFKGLTVKLGGAFAAYFLVFFVLWSGLNVETERFHYHTWTINGSVAFPGGDAAVNKNDITCYMRPPDLHVQGDGSFQFEIPVREDINGAPEWPQLSMEIGGFIPAIVHLYHPTQTPKYGVAVVKEDYDAKNRRISLIEPIVFRPKTSQPAYEPAKSEQPIAAKPMNEGSPRPQV